MAGPGSLQSYEIESECLRDWLAGDTLKYTVGWARIDFKAIHSVVRREFSNPRSPHGQTPLLCSLLRRARRVRCPLESIGEAGRPLSALSEFPDPLWLYCFVLLPESVLIHPPFSIKTTPFSNYSFYEHC